MCVVTDSFKKYPTEEEAYKRAANYKKSPIFPEGDSHSRRSVTEMSIACYAHAQESSVDSCRDCNRGLCKSCNALVQPPLCAQCLEHRASSLVRRIAQRALHATLFAAVAAWMVQPLWRPHLHPNAWPSVLTAYLALSVFYGAEVIKRLPPAMGRIASHPTWFLAAAVAGAFTLPFLSVKALLEVQEMQALSDRVYSRLRPPTVARILSVQVE